MELRKQSLVPQQSSQEEVEAINAVLNIPLPQNHAQNIFTIQGFERSFNSQFGLSVHVRWHNKKRQINISSFTDIYFTCYKEMHNLCSLIRA